MAYQRPFLIQLKRSDSHERWGFGINGGSDYGRPLFIATVAEDSVAERCGLHEGDEVIQVGRVNIQDLTLGQAQELLARCGNKIEMFVIREDLLSQRKGKEPPIVKAVVHNPYNSPLQLYSTENIADALHRQTEVLTEGQVSTDEEEGPENLSFKQKSAVFQLLEEQAKQESQSQQRTRSPQSTVVRKPKTAPPPPPPKPKPPSQQELYNGHDSTLVQQYTTTYPAAYQQQQQQQTRSQVEYQTRVTNQYQQYQYQQQQQQPGHYQQTVYQTTYQQSSPGYQSPSAVNYPQSPASLTYQQSYQRPKSPVTSHGYQSVNSYQQNYQQPHSPKSPTAVAYNQTHGYQQLNQTSQYQSSQGQKSPTQATSQYRQFDQQSQSQQVQQQRVEQQSQSQQVQQQRVEQSRTHQQQSQAQQESQRSQRAQQQQQTGTSVSKAEFKIGPPPPPRGSSTQKDKGDMTAVYRQQYEQHLQQHYDQQQQCYENHYPPVEEKPRAHIITGNIFENNSTSGTPVTYKAPPAAPSKPSWPPSPTAMQNDLFRQYATPPSPSGMRNNIGSVWPPKKSAVTDLPRTGFNAQAVREQSSGRRCVWPPTKAEDEMRSGRTTPQSPMMGRRIQWNPSPSPPTVRRLVSPSRRKDIVWPPPSPNDKENQYYQHQPRASPRLTRKARFDDYVKEHASINVPQTYRAPPGTQHVEIC